jgi:hypothetical protein
MANVNRHVLRKTEAKFTNLVTGGSKVTRAHERKQQQTQREMNDRRGRLEEALTRAFSTDSSDDMTLVYIFRHISEFEETTVSEGRRVGVIALRGKER